ncbi:hypothetical protein [Flavobacterium pectinovorum]|uniref:Lipoprotein n=1 Tax=Flavobacterium pectinovorum TaxID=29533 RepID=A0AB36P3H7_9FLAO|nr:hypothetical protein [Flavobacterium pectinovorum]OXB06465.1 hypothetical protein B0A72_05300 [Flavobacterium pectinovorum]SHL90279.1 hypothetical protein SAMN05444387_1399 [Flavobacterium pectinovorum]
MKPVFTIVYIILSVFLISACTNKKVENVVEKDIPKTEISVEINKNEESIEGIYKTAECDISVEITKNKDGYQYFLKTNLRKVKGKATFSTNESGEKYLVLEGIKWDEYEGDISNEEENDSLADSKPKHELEIPVGIDASYGKDTLTIQNYGNAMNSYTKISECGLKYIQLVKK